MLIRFQVKKNYLDMFSKYFIQINLVKADRVSSYLIELPSYIASTDRVAFAATGLASPGRWSAGEDALHALHQNKTLMILQRSEIMDNTGRSSLGRSPSHEQALARLLGHENSYRHDS